jgi:hypothetical protein
VSVVAMSCSAAVPTGSASAASESSTAAPDCWAGPCRADEYARVAAPPAVRPSHGSGAREPRTTEPCAAPAVPHVGCAPRQLGTVSAGHRAGGIAAERQSPIGARKS